jgi:DNA-binding transcriptional ArsR family regulator
MVMYGTGLDAIFAALADPTRRRMVERLARHRCSIGAVGAGLPISQPAVSKHVRILERSGLVRRTVAGRVHQLQLAPGAMRAASTWIERQRKFWTETLDRLDDVLSQGDVKK